MNIDVFLNDLWQDYTSVSPNAARIHQIFSDEGEEVVNDHVAFRTFNIAPINLSSLEKQLISLGYQPLDDYRFSDRHLIAKSYRHNEAGRPLIFLSELQTEALTEKSQEIIQRLCQQIPDDLTQTLKVFMAGTPWSTINWQEYQQLHQDSDYAAWLATMGLRANHFTVSINHLKNYSSVSEVLDHVESFGFTINESGGRIKGGERVLLEQGATLAEPIEYRFSDQSEHLIPACFYEFARRFPTKEGELYQGFVEANANRIFDSTAAKY